MIINKGTEIVPIPSMTVVFFFPKAKLYQLDRVQEMFKPMCIKDQQQPN